MFLYWKKTVRSLFKYVRWKLRTIVIWHPPSRIWKVYEKLSSTWWKFYIILFSFELALSLQDWMGMCHIFMLGNFSLIITNTKKIYKCLWPSHFRCLIHDSIIIVSSAQLTKTITIVGGAVFQLIHVFMNEYCFVKRQVSASMLSFKKSFFSLIDVSMVNLDHRNRWELTSFCYVNQPFERLARK